MTNSNALLHVEGLSVCYGQTRIIDGLTFHVVRGNTLVLLGESGCGKTTLLRALAGLVPLHSGEVLIDSIAVQDVEPQRRGILYLDQEPLLFEHLTVAQNIGFALQIQRKSSGEIAQQTKLMLEAMDLVDHAEKYDSQLSGGQKQRVTFARAILARPKLLLLDEPFCSLDAKTRGHMQKLFAQMSTQFGLTSVFVTHDVKEALIVGQEFGRLVNGKLISYSCRSEFMNDEATGIPEEIRFWAERAEQ
ncbi:MAG: ATP-binding cassette domain-containing protein [Planctomycetaceae bacterium]|nr:ATP-binding cassette domain-containing protein [Planctomycetaceae bacterium]